MDTIIALVNYFSVMFSADPDYMNDWLTHLPAHMQATVTLVGFLVESIRGV